MPIKKGFTPKKHKIMFTIEIKFMIKGFRVIRFAITLI